MYVVNRKTSYRHGSCFELQNVLGRSNILIHKGNYNSDTKGCILIGNGFKDINQDFEVDVLNSKIAMNNLLRTLKTTTTIQIKNLWLPKRMSSYRARNSAFKFANRLGSIRTHGGSSFENSLGMCSHLCQEIAVCQLQKRALQDGHFEELPYNIKQLYN